MLGFVGWMTGSYYAAWAVLELLTAENNVEPQVFLSPAPKCRDYM